MATYQKKFSGNDASVSFIISTDNNSCKGKLMDLGMVPIYIESNGKKCRISVMNIISAELNCGKTYFVVIRWSKSMNCIDMNTALYTYPTEIPQYMLQKYHWKYDIDNISSTVKSYDIELEQCTESNIAVYSFSGTITDIKVFDTYIDDYTILLQMYPTHGNLLVNDTARKFVDMPGVKTN